MDVCLVGGDGGVSGQPDRYPGTGSVGLFRQPGFDAGGGPPVHHTALDGFIQLGIGLAEESRRRFGVRILAQALDGGPESGLDRGVTPLTHAFLTQTLLG